MDFLGRATDLKLTTKINGTHSLTFSMPDKYFDSFAGDWVTNPFIKEIYNERKLKLFYKNEWYEFFVKSVNQEKHFKSYIYKVTCEDSFIDELSRNGYGITFDTELYNNVEEIGTFTNEILKDSLWHYEPKNNWGDFTEYKEEKLFKIPVNIFKKISGFKLNFDTNIGGKIENCFTKEKRNIQLSDDAATEAFWDKKNDDFMRIDKEYIDNIENDGYIYVPYSQLDFCYAQDTEGFPNLESDSDFFKQIYLQATEQPQNYKYVNKDSVLSKSGYAIAPKSLNPKSFIQFMAFPKAAILNIDESGLILNTDFHYIMTVEMWNELVVDDLWYIFEDTRVTNLLNINKNLGTINHTFKYLAYKPNEYIKKYGNKYVYYEGYLNNWGHTEINCGKNISIADRSELNISEEIDQYVTVYNNNANDFSGLFLENWEDKEKYQVCSKTETRQIVPQLARNLVQNNSNFKSTDGWEIADISTKNSTSTSAQLQIGFLKEQDLIKKSYLFFTPHNSTEQETASEIERKNTIINFGIIGQEKKIEKGKFYGIGISFASESSDSLKISIGEGRLESTGNYIIDNPISFSLQDFCDLQPVSFQLDSIDGIDNFQNGYIIFQLKSDTIENPYFSITSDKRVAVEKIEFFELFSKGKDEFENAYYKYSGREISSPKINEKELNTLRNNYNIITKITEEEMRRRFLFEDNIMKGSTYEFKKYFIQRLKLKDDNQTYDTFKAKAYISENVYDDLKLPLDSSIYTEDDYEIETNYINLSNCPHYNSDNISDSFDCKYNNESHICYYQKFGYCPFLFKTEKHCRKVRTLNGEKSNRFNLTQEVSKVFHCYPVYYTEHDEMGRTKTMMNSENEEVLDKKVFYITEKGVENQLGFRYEQNLSNIERTIDSKQIVTKLYVQDVDSSISKTGLCSIKTAEDNPSKDSFVLDFSYYLTKGLLDKDSVQRDLYGIERENLQGFLKKLGFLNTEYDKLSNNIIKLQDSSYTELEANLEVNLTGIETATQQLRKYEKMIEKYKPKNKDDKESDIYLSYLDKYNEQQSILRGLISDTYLTNSSYNGEKVDSLEWFKAFEPTKDTLKEWKDNHKYKDGMLGQFNSEYIQIQNWKKWRAKILKEINSLSSIFYKKYEPFLKEGTWSDSNYLTDNAYYFGALEVAKEGAIPKVTYSIKVIDISALPEYKNYNMNIADITYVEDIGMFGVNSITGLPNRLKVIISSITNNLDNPSEDSVDVQNYTTQFEDLFQQVTASVQSLQFNENLYKRSSNFTASQDIKEESLQGALDSNNLTLIKTQENNISIDSNGQSGSDINNHNNKYKLDGQGLFFTNNGGVSWNVGVTPSGINADYIKTGQLDAGKIKIVDSSYVYFSWDKNGIAAYRNPLQNTNINNPLLDYALYNKYGLSIINQGKVRLRAGYDSTSVNGEISSENTQGQNIGFFLYDNEGNTIFRTESYDNGNEHNSARLSLRGEMFITDSRLQGAAADDNYVVYNPMGELIEVTLPIYLKDNNPPEELKQTESSGPLECIYITDNIKKYSYTFLQRKILNDEVYGYNSETDTYYKAQNTTENCYLSSGLQNDTSVYYTNISDKNKFQYANSQKTIYNNYTGDIINTSGRTPFFVQAIGKTGVYWLNYKTVKEAKSDNDDSIGLFINNKMIDKMADGQTGELRDKRVFSCLYRSNNKYQNILSILKNGTLTIGGTVSYNGQISNISQMPDTIAIDNPGIKLSKDSNGVYKIAMDFNNFVDLNGNNLASSISGTQGSVDALRGRIDNLEWNMDQENNYQNQRLNDLESRITALEEKVGG